MSEVILSSEEVTVTGGPASVNVDIDFGPKGQRGSLIQYGMTDPNSSGTAFQQTPNELDWYINLNPSSPDYLFLYQYVSRGGPSSWYKIFKILPNTFNVNKNVVFSDGTLVNPLYNETSPIPGLIIGTEFIPQGVALVPLEISNTTAPLLGGILSGTTDINAHVSIQTSTLAPIASNFVFDPATFGYDPSGIYSVYLVISATQNVPVGQSIVVAPVTGNAIANISINVVEAAN